MYIYGKEESHSKEKEKERIIRNLNGMMLKSETKSRAVSRRVESGYLYLPYQSPCLHYRGMKVQYWSSLTFQITSIKNKDKPMVSHSYYLNVFERVCVSNSIPNYNYIFKTMSARDFIIMRVKDLNYWLLYVCYTYFLVICLQPNALSWSICIIMLSNACMHSCF